MRDEEDLKRMAVELQRWFATDHQAKFQAMQRALSGRVGKDPELVRRMTDSFIAALGDIMPPRLMAALMELEGRSMLEQLIQAAFVSAFAAMAQRNQKAN